MAAESADVTVALTDFLMAVWMAAYSDYELGWLMAAMTAAMTAEI